MSTEIRASSAVRMLYRPVGTLSGVVAHVVADAVFKSVWRRTGAQGGAPVALQSSTDCVTSWWPRRCEARSRAG